MKTPGQIIYDFRQKTIDGHMPDWDDEESVSDEDREWYEEQANEVLKNDTIRKQLAEALEESNALNINWSSETEPENLFYYSEYKNIIKMGNKALSDYEKSIKLES